MVEPDKRGRYEDGAERVAADRGEFARDRARVLHSYAFRRLADKTQVVSPGQDDFPRTRLTHSLEVAQIAREIGDALGCDPDVTDTAGLAHDLGHPPFGHNGEDALNQVAVGIGGFEGNAQTLRLLTRLEAKVLSDGRSAGLNLTRASLDAACKYPWPAGNGAPKFGFYEQDRLAYQWVRDSRPDGVRCLEAQVMDWSDDVAYSVHDVEDGVHSGLVKLAELTDEDLAELCEHAALRYSTWPAARLGPVLVDMLALPALRDLAGYDGSFAGQAAAKRATSELTGRFAGAAVSATRAKHGDVPLGRYSAELIVPESIVAECALLKAIAYRYVMQRSGVAELLADQRRTLIELADALYDLGLTALSTVQHDAWRRANDDAERLRVVVDQIAQLTDSAALSWHTRLVRPDSPRR
ncbi:MAG: deoxyguanosinetriphosphate triphosphohydrolase [Frankiales bacterium]|nr:deoxyguanosinetriphosphate triphosphohydrolase [Frankiales bacterium]